MLGNIDKLFIDFIKIYMKTLTITDAKKNLERWLAAAARGEDIGIVCGSNIVALRRVEVESTDYEGVEIRTGVAVATIEAVSEREGRRLVANTTFIPL